MTFVQRHAFHLVVLVVVVLVALTATTVVSYRPDQEPGLGAPERSETAPEAGTGREAEPTRVPSPSDPQAVAALQARRDDSDPEVAAPARLRLAVLWLRDGDALAALAEAEELRSLYPETPEADLAPGVIGRAHARLGRADEAIAAYDLLASTNPELAAYLHLEAARALRSQGRDGAAIERLERAIAEEPIVRAEVAALEMIREIHLGNGDVAAAAATIERLLDVATFPVYRAQLTYDLASAWLLLGDERRAAGAFRQAVKTAPDQPVAARALAALERLGRAGEIAATERGMIWFNGGEYAAALAAFDEALRADPDDDEARYYRVRSQVRAGNTAGAAGGFMRVAERHPDSDYAPDALLQAGRFYEHAGQTEAANAAFRRLLEEYPDADAAAEARFELGLNAWQAGDYQTALTMFEGATGSPEVVARGLFWTGKTYERAGDAESAARAWIAAAATDPRGFHGLRAADLLRGERIPVATDDLSVPGLDGRMVEQRERWFQDQGTTAAEAIARVHADEGWTRLDRLLAIGMTTEAGWEADALAARYRNDAPLLVALASELYTRQRPAEAYRLALQIMAELDLRDAETWAAVGPILYPPAFLEHVQELSVARGVDPLLMLALIRQESAFNVEARSWAEARGLTQVIPSTGQAIAAGLGYHDWTPDDLYRPRVAIEFGAVYLAERLARYDGHLFPALAAYNAGDGPVGGWLAAAAGDPDLFAESITYPETRAYVRIVYRNYRNYESLYRPAG